MPNKKIKYWSDYVTKHSFALDLEEGVFTWKNPKKIAKSLKKSAEQSLRRKAAPFQSAMSMLNFYINRAGSKLEKNQKQILEKAKQELRILFNKDWFVGGMITPDTYVINKTDWVILDANISKQEKMIVRGGSGAEEAKVPEAEQEKQKFSNKQIIELAKLCARIEEHYAKPQDIEWAYEGGKLYITQSRPITTL